MGGHILYGQPRLVTCTAASPSPFFLNFAFIKLVTPASHARYPQLKTQDDTFLSVNSSVQ